MVHRTAATILIVVVVITASTGAVLITHPSIIGLSKPSQLKSTSGNNQSNSDNNTNTNSTSENSAGQVIYINEFKATNNTIEVPHPWKDALNLKVYSSNLSQLSISVVAPDGFTPYDSGYSHLVSGYFNTTIPLYFSYVNQTGDYKYICTISNGKNTVNKMISINSISHINDSLELPSKIEVGVNRNLSFTSITGGGSVSNYTMNILGPNGKTTSFYSKVNSYDPPIGGTYKVYASIKDQYGYTCSTEGSFYVNSTLTISIGNKYVQPILDSVDAVVGQNATFYSTVSFGVFPYYYVWTYDGQEVSTSPSVNVYFNQTGIFSLRLTVTDSINVEQTTGTDIYVNVPPSISLSSNLTNIPHASANEVYANLTNVNSDEYYQLTIYVNGVADGGEVVYGNPIYNNFSEQIQNWFYSIGYNTITAKFSMGVGYTLSKSITVYYESAPIPFVSVQRWTGDQGQRDWLNGSASSGVGPYNYTWYIGGVIYSRNSDIDPSLYGNSLSPKLLVTDALGNSAYEEVYITVNPPLIVNVTMSSYNLSSVLDTPTLTLSISGGTYFGNINGAYNIKYEYTILVDGSLYRFSNYPTEYLDTGWAQGTVSILQYGNNTIQAIITDAAGNTVTSTVHITVN